jgi:hypothetical protein
MCLVKRRGGSCTAIGQARPENLPSLATCAAWAGPGLLRPYGRPSIGQGLTHHPHPNTALKPPRIHAAATAASAKATAARPPPCQPAATKAVALDDAVRAAVDCVGMWCSGVVQARRACQARLMTACHGPRQHLKRLKDSARV